MSSQAGARLADATIRILDGPNAAKTATTDGNGTYRFDALTFGNANVSATAAGYNESAKGVVVNGTNALDFVLQTTEPWAQNGTGNNVFDKPSYVTRVRITGDYGGFSTNFVMWCGSSLVVNELLGTGWDTTHYEGTHSVTGCTEVRVEISTGVRWSMTEVR